MQQMPGLQNLPNCGDLSEGAINEKPAFSFAKEPIATLQFTGTEGLTPDNFERLCCRLMAKVFNLYPCSRYGSGKNQQGIDIYGYRSASPSSLVAIQCKRHENFTLSTLRDAVRKFKNGSFYGIASEFIILVACDLLPKGVQEEEFKIREDLSTKQCVFAIWNGEKIAEELKRFPEIVEAFYRQEVVQAFCKPYGVRQRLLELMLRSYKDQGNIPLSDKLVPNEDQEDVAQFLAEKTTRLSGDELLFKNFSYTDAFIRIDCHLPTQWGYSGTCLITITQANLYGGFFSLGHTNIMRLFLRGTRTYIRKYRPFFSTNYPTSNV